MAEQEDPARRESERLAQGEETELPGTGVTGEGNERESIESGPAESSRSASGLPDDPSETSRRGMPGYQ